MRDVVINQEAQEQLALRKGSSSLVIPNVFDFDNPPDPTDEYASDVRSELGLEEDDFFMIWEKIMHSYNDELSYIRLKGNETADLETSH